jgi:hypothetical protein
MKINAINLRLFPTLIFLSFLLSHLFDLVVWNALQMFLFEIARNQMMQTDITNIKLHSTTRLSVTRQSTAAIQKTIRSPEQT